MIRGKGEKDHSCMEGYVMRCLGLGCVEKDTSGKDGRDNN